MPGRDCFIDTIWTYDEDGKVTVLEGVNVTLYKRGTSTLATMYDHPSNNTPINPPFVTGPGGLVEFWAVAGAYDLHVEDSQAPERIGDKVIGWNASPAGVGQLPGDIIEQSTIPSDRIISVLREQLATDVQRALHPIGEVIYWWCPSSINPNTQFPAGFVPAEGQTLAAGDHDFPGGGSITLPDLRNVFVIGADRAKTRATGGSQLDNPGNAPGLAYVGGSNSHTLTSGESGTNGSGATDPVNNFIAVFDEGEPPGTGPNVDDTNHTYNALKQFWSGSPASELSNSANHAHGLAERDADFAHNNMPRHHGLIALMKVKYA